MSEWIDHEAEAQDWIADAPAELANAGLNAGTAERALLCAQLAQAHATLALVEQQRIANLIALGRLQIASGLDGASTVVGDGSAFRALYPGGPNTPLAPGIARALRIGDGNE